MDKVCIIRTCPVGDCSSPARLLPHAVNCTRFCFCRCLRLFVCVWNISGSAERICAKFTGNTCLVPLSDEFEDQGQRSKVKVTRDKNGVLADISRSAERICDIFTQKTCLVPHLDEFEGQGQFWRPACALRFMFVKTSLLWLVFLVLFVTLFYFFLVPCSRRSSGVDGVTILVSDVRWRTKLHETNYLSHVKWHKIIHWTRFM